MRTAGVLCGQAGSTHGEQELGTQLRALGELTCLGKKLVSRIGVGWNERIAGVEHFLRED